MLTTGFYLQNSAIGSMIGTLEMDKQLTVDSVKWTVKVWPTATYYNHLQSKYHNCQLSTVNCQLI